MKYLVYFGSSALVIAALLGYAVLADDEPLRRRDAVPAEVQPAPKATSKNCKRGKGVEQISPEALVRSL